MFCEMSPPITASISQTAADEWAVGSSVWCRKVESPPVDALAAWQAADKSTFCLLPSGGGPTETKVAAGAPISAAGMIYNAGTSAAVWAIGGAIFKAKAWVEGLETEASTLRYVQTHFPSIPTPEIIHDWIDKRTARSFLVLRPAEGQTLQQAWPVLSVPQRRRIAAEVAGVCATLAAQTSDILGAASGRCGIQDNYLMPKRPDDAPSWRPIPFPPLTAKQAEAYLPSLMDTSHSPRAAFHFCHADLSPTNIMVSPADGAVTSILDWESAAFYPRIWIATKARVSYGFILEDHGDDNVWAWRNVLLEALEKHNVCPNVQGFRAFQEQKKASACKVAGDPPRWYPICETTMGS